MPAPETGDLLRMTQHLVLLHRRYVVCDFLSTKFYYTRFSTVFILGALKLVYSKRLIGNCSDWGVVGLIESDFQSFHSSTELKTTKTSIVATSKTYSLPHTHEPDVDQVSVQLFCMVAFFQIRVFLY